nr:hypothetical protein [Tanacetum cinerariifolium]
PSSASGPGTSMASSRRRAKAWSTPRGDPCMPDEPLMAKTRRPRTPPLCLRANRHQHTRPPPMTRGRVPPEEAESGGSVH